MLPAIISYLTEQLETLEYMDKVGGLACTITRDGQTLTGQYEQGELVPVDFDTYFSQLFFMLKGKVTRDTAEDKYTACTNRVKEIYNLSLILYRQGLDDINCHSRAQDMAWHIAQQLTGKHNQLARQAGYDEVSMRVKNIGLDGPAIYCTLFSGESRLTENDALIEINFEVETEGEERCFVSYPCLIKVQGDAGSNTAFGTQNGENNELINGNF
jgi:hypothetical protein